MKYDWRKQDKALYLPPAEPKLVQVPAFPVFILKGEGDPNGAAFAEAVKVLYSLTYAVKMLPKQGAAPGDYYGYRVFPLEGVWDLSEQGRSKAFLDKNDLLYTLMIRQPDFVTPALAGAVMDKVARTKPHPLNGQAVFGTAEDGLCVQMMHRGPFDTEAESFARMEQFCLVQGLRRISLTHREIYLSDPRRSAPDKQRTVLRFQVERQA
ncbi:GyrI-like domain-containing protein [Paenibacillus tengchongensis]|uniref:GyrI-like domain-containing protein n=1 Tax=Paenibacillus tengchongensis TaxID=2608684 RepID=UPI00124E2343|nr:GyrI-like domain-containing protein [Paenibacillus tengchongensis]